MKNPFLCEGCHGRIECLVELESDCQLQQRRWIPPFKFDPYRVENGLLTAMWFGDTEYHVSNHFDSKKEKKVVNDNYRIRWSESVDDQEEGDGGFYYPFPV